MRSLKAGLAALLLAAPVWAQAPAPAPAPNEPAKPAEPPPPAPGQPPAASAPGTQPAAPPEDDATIDSGEAPAAASSEPAASPAATAAPPPAAKLPTDTKAAAAPAAAPEPAPAEEDPTESILSKAGYTLTPGVSSLPVRDEFVFGGYFQGQYESHQNSEDLLQQGGTLLNQDRFSIRRGRFQVSRDWEFTRVFIEIDGNTTRGPALRFHKAEASLIYGRSKDKDQPALAQFTIGQFDLPFGFELTYSSKLRFFMERSQISRAMFPGEPDVGARLSGGYKFIRYSVAVTNGEPLDGRSAFVLQDPNANKDITARLGAQTKPTPTLALAGGISYNRGKGFSPGRDATKSTISWKDSDGNQIVDADKRELVGNAEQAAVAAQNFDRWAMGADVEVLLRTQLGWSMLYGEVIAASNMDRGLLISDPVANQGIDMRQFGYYVGLTQELTPYGVVGFRYDHYDPNADDTEQHQDKVVPVGQKIDTYSPMAGLVLPGRARLMFQYDVIRDKLGRDTRGVPTDFRNNQWFLRLQINM